ncbi:MAG: transcriptional regulator [Elusimicrobia bacterium RIFOXYA1_FULL_47_7]|nr:MAG: transcriptional regulator [Elusimicrobia bacterium RIFOXYA1_FULL_47_7]OGS09958.1 MAG: transcriptional regulator [Elusimicrobia bacterium RIFOXYB1_FULL_48_9]OGS15774.1 MAG: transcriptional regulator [Elusimicrobia bacterium RIFOXYA2_FULL_47_53]OGS31067.1 MAG: transcriptional regulator [Elusimicrobia bacterium RIFOXYB2_FULL_46_23]
MHARMCRVFTSAKRLEVLNLLRNRELSVGELMERAGISQANLSQHLGVLRNEGIVQTRRKGVKIYYSLTSPKISEAFDKMREVLLEKLNRTAKLSVKARAVKTLTRRAR